MLNVFVSSTYEDLQEHRTEIRALIEALGLNDIAMETWGERPCPPCDEIERAIRTSNIYLGIIGWKRGSLIPELQKSYVRYEYELARNKSLQMLVYLADPKAPVLPTSMDQGLAGEEIQQFRSEIENERSFIWGYFADPLDLVRRVSGSLFRVIADTDEFRALSSKDQLILELRQVMQADFLTRLNQIRVEQTSIGSTENGNEWFLPSLGRCNMGEWYIPREQVRQQVADWLIAGSTTYLFLVGPSGIGKTNFLLDFIYRVQNEQRALKKHALLILPLGSYVLGQSFFKNVQIFVNRSRRLKVHINETAFRQLIENGRIILILDGLDEFARQQGEAACEHLFATLKNEVRPPHTIVSCRDHILRRLRGATLLRGIKIDEVQIPPLARSEVVKALEMRMGRASTPYRAASRHPGLFRFAENPLLFEMMCEMSDRSWRRLIDAKTIGRVYDLWFEEAVEAGVGGERVLFDSEIQDAKLKIGRVARIMLEERSDLIQRTQLDEQHLPSGCLRVSGQPFGILIQETPDEWGFVHDSLRDFVLAKSVATELTTRRYELLESTTHLDYVGGEMYRFLRDLFEKDEESLAQHVDDAMASKTASCEAWNNIVWNCFDAAGMTATGCTAGRIIDKALEIIPSAKAVDDKHCTLSGEAMYNTLRCVERLHPSAPRPYCDYVISKEWSPDPDWGLFGAWAVRGFQRKERYIGPYPPMTYVMEKNEGTAHRQVEVSACLLDLLENPPDQIGHKWLRFVAVNCTFALIRWLHPNHVNRLKNFLSRGQLGPESRANIFLAITRFRNPYLLEGTSDLFSGMILNFSYLSLDMIPMQNFVFRGVEFRHKHSRFDGIDPYNTELFEDCLFPL